MSIGDWANSATNVVVGILLGWVAYRLLGLATTGFWPLAIIIPAIFLGVLLFDGWFSAAVDKVFPTGIKPARTPRRTRKPFARRLSLPLGISVGFVIALLGFDLPFLAAI